MTDDAAPPPPEQEQVTQPAQTFSSATDPQFTSASYSQCNAIQSQSIPVQEMSCQVIPTSFTSESAQYGYTMPADWTGSMTNLTTMMVPGDGYEYSVAEAGYSMETIRPNNGTEYFAFGDAASTLDTNFGYVQDQNTQFSSTFFLDNAFLFGECDVGYQASQSYSLPPAATGTEPYGGVDVHNAPMGDASQYLPQVAHQDFSSYTMNNSGWMNNFMPSMPIVASC